MPPQWAAHRPTTKGRRPVGHWAGFVTGIIGRRPNSDVGPPRRQVESAQGLAGSEGNKRR